MEKYRYLEHTADVLFQAFGRTDREMMSNAAEAMANVMYDLGKVEGKESEKIEVHGKNLEELLHNFLAEIVFRIGTNEKLYNYFGINSLRKEPKTSELVMETELRGEKINPEKHLLKTEIKAVTWNQFRVWEEGGKWIAQVLVDV